MLDQEILVQQARAALQEDFLRSELWNQLGPKELKKTKEELEIIDLAQQLVQQKINETIEGFSSIDINPEDIHVFSPSDFLELKTRIEKEYNLKLEPISSDGNFRPLSFFFFWPRKVFTTKSDTLSEFTNQTVHELIHAKSVWAILLTIRTKNIKIGLRRAGLVIRAKGEKKKKLKKWGEYFESFNEAVIEQLTIEICRELQSIHPILKHEAVSLEWLKGHPRKTEQWRVYHRYLKPLEEVVFLKILDTRIDKDGKWELKLKPIFFSYQKQRQRLHCLIRKISQRKNIDYDTAKKEVMSVLVQALFTGHILSVIRLIDRTLGRGTFRHIGERGKLPSNI